jgi:YegS/Rv2252/BmrU family lipid kinase
MDSKDWFIIVNPSSGGGVSKAKLERISQCLKQNKILGNIYKTSLEKNAESLVGEAILKGFKRIICVGGDGTVHNLVNGVFNQSIIEPSEIIVGLIPVGTGNDWARHHNIPTNYKKAIKVIAKGNVKQQDLGAITVLGKRQRIIYFMNYAGLGFDGYVISKIEKYKFLGPLSYLVAAIANFVSFKNINLNFEINSVKNTASAFMLGVGLCKYTGGGMRLAKNPDHKDGLLDITLAQDFTKLDVVKSIPRLFNGNLFKSKKVSSYKTEQITVEIVEGADFAQADGELIRGTSFEFKILENAFNLFK